MVDRLLFPFCREEGLVEMMRIWGQKIRTSLPVHFQFVEVVDER